MTTPRHPCEHARDTGHARPDCTGRTVGLDRFGRCPYHPAWAHECLSFLARAGVPAARRVP